MQFNKVDYLHTNTIAKGKEVAYPIGSLFTVEIHIHHHLGRYY